MVDATDSDAIWKPGYDGPAPTVSVAPMTHASATDASATEAPARTPRRRRRRFVGGIGIALVLIAIFVVVDPLGPRDDSNSDDGDAAAVSDDRLERVVPSPDPSVFGGPADRRLPVDAAPLWAVEIGHEGDHWVEVIRRDLVVAAISERGESAPDTDPSAAPVTTVVGLDASTGEQRWSLPVDGEPSEVRVVGAVDDVLVLEQPGVVGPVVAGVDIVTGETRWSADGGSNGGHVGLAGTSFIARLPSSADRLVALLDAASGAELGTIGSDPTAAGRPGGWSTTGGGTWHVVDEGVVTEYDLGVELGEATVVGKVEDVSTPRLVVGGQVAVVDDGGSITFDGGGARGPVTVSAEVPGSVRSLTPVSDSTFVVSAPGSIAGVGIEGGAADVRWLRRDGVIVRQHPTVGGSIVQLATRGGGAMQLVDGQTGDTIEHLTMMPGALQAIVVAGDGAVVLRAADVGVRLVGIGLDGSERWSILGAAPIMVGDRIAVRAVSVDVGDVEDENSVRSAQRLRITAYGDA